MDSLPEYSESHFLPTASFVALHQQTVDALVDWSEIFAWGDTFAGDTDANLVSQNNSTMNHVRALHALKTAFQLIPVEDREHPTIFLRPDVEILEQLPISLILDLLQLPPRRFAYGQTDGTAIVPMWHSWDGVNDRFAVCSGGSAASAYAERIDCINPYLRLCSKPIHPESFLLHTLMLRRVQILPVIQTPMVRIRSGGQVQPESFLEGASSWSHASESWRLLVDRNAHLLDQLVSARARIAEQDQAIHDLAARLSASQTIVDGLRSALDNECSERVADAVLHRSLTTEHLYRIDQLETQLAVALADVSGLSIQLEAEQRRCVEQQARLNTLEDLQARAKQLSVEADLLLEQFFWAQEELERLYLADPEPLPTTCHPVEHLDVLPALSSDTLHSINHSRRQLLEEASL